MDCPSSYPIHGNLPSEQENFHGIVPPLNQGLGSHIDGQQQINSALWNYLEQDRQIVARVHKALNGQVQVMLQEQMASQNQALLNIVGSVAGGVLTQMIDEINHLYMELQKTREAFKTVLQERNGWIQAAAETYEINQFLMSEVSSMKEITSHANQTLNMEGTAVETGHPSLICKLCHSHHSCIVLLPCQHLCACKSCGLHTATCPICNSVKVGAIEARFS